VAFRRRVKRDAILPRATEQLGSISCPTGHLLRAQLVRHALGDLQQWQTQLRALANHLEDLEALSRSESESGQADSE